MIQHPALSMIIDGERLSGGERRPHAMLTPEHWFGL
jgi:hypothetical protein